MKKNNFKNIGIVGGAGPKASSLLLEKIISKCQHYFNAQEDKDFPEITLLSFPFSNMLSAQESTENFTYIQKELLSCFKKLYNTESQVVGIACNTLHSFLTQNIVNQYNFKFINLIKETINHIHSRDLKNILVLGTETTISNNIYSNNIYTDKARINWTYPASQDQKVISKIIDNILTGRIVEQDAHLINSIIQKYSQEYTIDSVLLGCTELPIIHNAFNLNTLFNTSLYIVDTLDILADSLIFSSKNT